MNDDIRRNYLETAVQSATPVDLVVMLYDLLIEDLRKASHHTAQCDPAACADAVRHALLVLEQLQGTLNLEAGGDAAQNMDQLYTILRTQIIQAQGGRSVQVFDNVKNLLLSLRAAWQQLKSAPPVASSTALAAPKSGADHIEHGGSTRWSA